MVSARRCSSRVSHKEKQGNFRIHVFLVKRGNSELPDQATRAALSGQIERFLRESRFLGSPPVLLDAHVKQKAARKLHETNDSEAKRKRMRIRDVDREEK